LAPSLTRVLQDGRGNEQAAAQAFALAYAELRRLANSLLRSQASGHTLQPTALVHEAYLKLLGHEQPTFESRAHFFAVSARVMRQILIDHARKHLTGKRGGGAHKLALDEAVVYAPSSAAQLVEIDTALEALATFDSRKAQVVEMRFFAGMTGDEIAEALGVSVPTVTRDLRLAQAWLATRLTP
jgi:RNA polymerase sigma factor (TIGR02999 family)